MSKNDVLSFFDSAHGENAVSALLHRLSCVFRPLFALFAQNFGLFVDDVLNEDVAILLANILELDRNRISAGVDFPAIHHPPDHTHRMIRRQQHDVDSEVGVQGKRRLRVETDTAAADIDFGWVVFVVFRMRLRTAVTN